MDVYLGKKIGQPGPHVCLCGRRGAVLNTRSPRHGDHRNRVYACKCGKRWSTIERRLDGNPTQGQNIGRKYAAQESREIRDQLLARIAVVLEEEGFHLKRKALK